MLVSKLAKLRADRGLTVPLSTLVAAMASVVTGTADGPRRLARTITYVGGPKLPGSRRAIGVWDGGTEQSNVLAVPDAEAAAEAAASNNQKSAIWFTPGPGADSLHVFHVDGDAKAARAVLAKHGVSYGTLVPSGSGTTVHVVDPGAEWDGVLPGKTVKGTATFKQLSEPQKLNRGVHASNEGGIIRYVARGKANNQWYLEALTPYKAPSGTWYWGKLGMADPSPGLSGRKFEDYDHFNHTIDTPLTPEEVWAHTDGKEGTARPAAPVDDRPDFTIPEDFYAA